MRHTFITNLQSAKVRRETLDDVDYLVVPMVMMTEGVHNGSQGPLYYPQTELEKACPAWNHKPIVVNHPKRNGVHTSGSDPTTIRSRRVGLVLNAHWDGKQRAEAWLDIKKLKKVAPEILEQIQNNEMVEVSTGLLSDTAKETGEWNGESYGGVVRNHRPDHLAILTDEVGACSIKDGAGLLQVNASFGDISTSLYEYVRKRYKDSGYIEDIYDGYFVYCLPDGKCWMQDYTVADDGTVTVKPSATQVREVYVTVDGAIVGNATNINKEVSMDKAKLVDHLITNGGYDETDRKMLEGFEEPKLKKMVDALTANSKKEEEKPAPTAKTQEPKTEEPKVEPTTNATVPKKQTMEEFIANAPAEMQDALIEGHRTAQAQRAELVKSITANAANIFTVEELAAKSLHELKGLAALAKPIEVAPEPTNRAPAIFAGAGGGIVNSKPSDKPMALPLPKMDFSK